MKIYRKNAEEALISALRLLHGQREYWDGRHFRLSRLNPVLRTRKSLNTLANFVKSELTDLQLEVYFCADGDVFLLFPKTHEPPIDKIHDKLRYLYATDPLVCNPSGENFSVAFSLERDFDSIFMEAHKKQIKNPANAEVLPDWNESAFSVAVAQRKIRLRPSILVVDDHSMNRMLVSEALTGAIDAKIIIAKDGAEALHQYCQHAPDMVFLDIEMPRMDGHRVLELISRNDKDAFIVMLTAKNFKEDVLKARENRAHGYITKPFNVGMINRYIELYQTIHPTVH
jgi:CheY-like chemotaxis protein